MRCVVGPLDVVVWDLGVPRSATFVSWLEHKCFLNVQKRLFKRFKIFPNSIYSPMMFRGRESSLLPFQDLPHLFRRRDSFSSTFPDALTLVSA